MFISAANGLLANDFDPDGGIVTATPQSGAATAQGGTVDVNADGSFEYFPEAGNTTTDTFTYTITDDDGKTDTGTVSIMFPEVIWYVDNSQGTNGDGTSGSPFNNLASAASASGPGHMIFVLSGAAPSVTGQNSGIILKNNQSLVGQGVDLVVTFNGTPQTLFPAGTPPVITHTAGTAVTLAQNNTIKGLNIGDSSNPVIGTGIADNGSSFGTLTVSGVNVTSSTGHTLNLDVPGTLAATFGSLSSSNSTGRGLRLSSVGGTFAVSGTTTISNPATEGVLLSSNTGTFNFGGMIITNTGNTGFSASSGGTVNVTGTANTINTTTGTALNLTSTTIGGSGMTFRSISASGAANGIVLNTTGTSGSFTVTGTGTVGSGGTIQNTTGSGIQLSSTANVSLTGMRIRSSGAHGINGSSGVSGLTLNSSLLEANGNGDNEHGVNLVNASGTFLVDGTTFNGAAEDLVHIDNTNTTLALTVQNGSHFEYPNPKGSAFANSAILLRPFGNSPLTVSIQGATFKNIVNNSLLMGGDNTTAGIRAVTFSNNTVTVDPALNQSCSVNPECRVGGVVMSARNTSTTNFVATGNTFTRASGAGVIELGSNETATLRARVETNNISNSLGDGFKIGSFQASRMILQFNGNTLTNIGGDGFEVAAGESTASASTDMDLVITNNTINGHTQNSAIPFVGGIGIFRFGDADQLLCLKLTGNTVTGTPANFFDVFLDGNFGALGGSITYEGSGTGPVTTARIKADNPGVTEANVGVSATDLSNATCQLPGI